MNKPAKFNNPIKLPWIKREMVDVDQLLANPFNWRIHSDIQQQALAGMVDDIGFVGAVEVNNNSGHMLDGHLRVILALRSGWKQLPVDFYDLTEDEEKKYLLSKDSIAAMALTDRGHLEDLLHQVHSGDERVQQLMDNLMIRNALIPPVDFEAEYQGMPEYAPDDLSPFRTVKVHFTCEEDVKKFEELIGYTISFHNFIWYPKQEIIKAGKVVEDE